MDEITRLLYCGYSKNIFTKPSRKRTVNFVKTQFQGTSTRIFERKNCRMDLFKNVSFREPKLWIFQKENFKDTTLFQNVFVRNLLSRNRRFLSFSGPPMFFSIKLFFENFLFEILPNTWIKTIIKEFMLRTGVFRLVFLYYHKGGVV